jgi:hypothetical protein
MPIKSFIILHVGCDIGMKALSQGLGLAQMTVQMTARQQLHDRHWFQGKVKGPQ